MTLPPSTRDQLADLQRLRVALVHYWFVRRRGGEQVLETLAEMFPSADIYSLVVDPACLPESWQARRVQTSFLQRIPGIRKHYKKFLALCPLALESFDLSGYDLVISSESGPAKGIITGKRTCHVCYCHTPMRYLWDMYFDYKQEAPGGRPGRLLYSLISHYMRLWDQASAARVDYFVANSNNVAGRIWKTYRRSADVVYPPVATEDCYSGEHTDNFYLVVSQLVRYKRVDLAIAACNQLGRDLVIIGDGEEFHRLRRMAGPSIRLLGWQDSKSVHDYYRRCRALLFPGEEDFGITPVEAQAWGRPVIAFGRGGALESVRGYFAGEDICPPDATGVFFDELSPEALSKAILEFESNEAHFSPATIHSDAQKFSKARFVSEITSLLQAKLRDFYLETNQSAQRSAMAVRQT